MGRRKRKQYACYLIGRGIVMTDRIYRQHDGVVEQAAYGHPLAQFPPCKACVVVMFMRKGSLTGN